MVSIDRFLYDADLLFIEIQKREKEAEKCRHMEFIAVRNIQRWVRGFLERQHIARLHNAAITIQKNWRGFCGRKIYLMLLKNTVEKMFEQYYNGMAGRIQKLWRGHVVRLFVYDHHLFRQWMAMVMMKNKEKQFDNKNFEGILREEEEKAAENKAKEHVLFILFKVHHLLRTYGVPGICSLLDSNQLSVIEQQLRELNLTEYIQSLQKKRAELREMYESPSTVSFPSGIHHRKCQEFWHKRIRIGIPPLFAQEEYIEAAYTLEAANRQYTTDEVDKPPMQLFSPPCHDDRHLMVSESPYAQTYPPLRETKPSCYMNPQGFVPAPKTEDASKTYQCSKGGPYKPDISKTDLFIHKHKRECNGLRRKESN